MEYRVIIKMLDYMKRKADLCAGKNGPRRKGVKSPFPPEHPHGEGQQTNTTLDTFPWNTETSPQTCFGDHGRVNASLMPKALSRAPYAPAPAGSR